MTSIAAFISILAGGAPQDPSGTPADAPGEAGVFASLLAATGTPQAAEGEIAAFPNPFNPVTAAQNEQDILATTQEDAALSKALSEGLGLPQDGAEIDAAIIEGPQTAGSPPSDTALKNSSKPIAPQNTGETVPATATGTPVQNTQTQQAAPAQDAVQTSVTDLKTARPDEIKTQERSVTPTGQADAGTRATGLENALNKVPQIARGNETANTAPPVQQISRGAPQHTNLSEIDIAQIVKGEAAPRPGSSEISFAVKSETAPRPEFTPGAPRIIQQLVKPGSGQTLIKFQHLTGADSASITSPPTLTVNVQAQAASPGPASANVPHVPVSALAVHIAQQARNGAKSFNIRLDPPELGRIEVRLEVSREGQVMTHLVVERAETLDLLQRDARQLERALQDAGLNTSEEDMKFSLKDQGLAQGGKGQETPDDEPGSRADKSNTDHALIPDEAMPPPTRYLASSGLDIRI